MGAKPILYTFKKAFIIGNLFELQVQYLPISLLFQGDFFSKGVIWHYSMVTDT